LAETARTDVYDPDAIRRLYDGMASDYAVRFGSELADADPDDPDLEFLAAAAYLFPEGPVLDVGCGPAQVARYLTGRGRKVAGIDFAPAMLAAAARLVPQASLIQGDLTELPFQPATCAGAVASYAVHHLPASRLATVLAGLRAVLKPGGILVVITHGASEGKVEEDRPGGEIVVSRYDPGDLGGRLNAAGFTTELLKVRPPRPGEYPADKIRIAARRLEAA
jgi:SAM-dependent methyltransferase